MTATLAHASPFHFMTGHLLSNDLSDVCLGKPLVRPHPSSATVGDFLRLLRGGSPQFLTFGSPHPSQFLLSKLSVVDVVCFLCSAAHLHDPSSALSLPVTSLFPSPLRLLHPRSSVRDALNEIADGAEIIAVPIRTNTDCSCSFRYLTREEFARYLLNSITLFSPIASLSVGALGVVRYNPPTVRPHDAAISSVAPFLADGIAVAVVNDNGRLLGEISPVAIGLCGCIAAAAALSVMSAEEFLTFLDRGPPSDVAVRALKARLEERGLKGMAELLLKDAEEQENDDDESLLIYPCSSSLSSSSSFSSAASSSSSSSDEEAFAAEKKTRVGRSNCRSRLLRNSKEAIACHRGSSLVGVMMRALAHRVDQVWVLDEEEDRRLVGVVVLSDIVKVFVNYTP